MYAVPVPRPMTVVYQRASCAEHISFPPALGVYDDSHRFSAHISTFIIVSRPPCTLDARVLSARPDHGLYSGVRLAPLGSSSPLICALSQRPLDISFPICSCSKATPTSALRRDIHPVHSLLGRSVLRLFRPREILAGTTITSATIRAPFSQTSPTLFD